MGNGINANFQSNLIKVDITGFNDGPMEADRSMAAFLPTTKIPIPLGEGPFADVLCVWCNAPRFEACNGGDDFEG